MNYFRNYAATLAVFVLFSGCALHTKPPLEYRPGAIVETLSSAVSLSVSTGDQGMGATGYMLYKHPDRMRMVILSPFGTTLMEVFVAGDMLTIIETSSGKAFAGTMKDLPAQVDLDTWKQARWVMDVEPAGSNLRNGTIERVNRMGVTESVTYENGLVTSKSLPNGDEARYSDYVVIDGVPLATEVIMESATKKRFRIKLNEPEINGALSADAFTPRLEGMILYPLSDLGRK